MGFGLWRLRHMLEWLPRDGPELGYLLAWRKHIRLLKSMECPKRMPSARSEASESGLPVHAMTGESHWHLTCFCLYSLLEYSQAALRLIVHEDGSLTGEQRATLQRIFPKITFLGTAQADEIVDQFLPLHRFPALREMRNKLGLTKKLVDVHAGNTGAAVFVDSDVMFYRDPVFLWQWFEAGQQPVYLLDYQNAYGYSASTLRDVYGGPVLNRVNTGLTGLRSPAIDWEKLEFWAARLLAAGGVNHFSEQALTAMLMSDLGGAPAPPEDYVVSPELSEILHPSAVMHHYVVPSRTWYYTDAIPNFMHGVAARC